MAIPKRWSRTVGTQRGNRIRVYERESGEDLSGPLQLGTLVARFLAGSTHTRDGSLKTVHYTKGCARFGAYMIEWFGAETPVSQLTPDRMPEYAAARRSGKVSGTPVGQTAV